jgi:cytochrome c-type biogenesis protein CcsB
MMMISYSTLIIGSLLSILYLAFLNFITENKKINLQIQNQESLVSAATNSKISLLQTVDIWSYRIIGLGFPFLTIGIISGAVWANEAWGSYWSWDPKETWALITWLVFAIYLHSRLLKGWQGEKAAVLGSCGFFVIWICYLGVNFLGKGLHSYGWVL